MAPSSEYEELIERGHALFRSRRFDEADAVLQEALAAAERELEPHAAELVDVLSRVAGARFDLGLELWGLRRFDEARAQLQLAFEIVKRYRADDYWSVSMIRGSLGALLTEMDTNEGLPLLEREVECAERKGHEAGRMVAHWFLGRGYLLAKRWSDAIRSLEAARRLARNERQRQQLDEWLAEARGNVAREH